MGAAHSFQNFAPSQFSAPHFEQRNMSSPGGTERASIATIALAWQEHVACDKKASEPGSLTCCRYLPGRRLDRRMGVRSRFPIVRRRD